MESSEATNQLLKKKYDLHKSPEVENAAKRTEARTDKKVPQDPLVRIGNYLNRFHEVTDRENPQEREYGIDAVKRLILSKYLTKIEDIPESYWKSQERTIRERGQQGDYDRFSEEEKSEWKRELSEGVLGDQHASLEQWIDYLASSESSGIPDPMKYWVFRNVINMQEFDKETHEFPKRSKGTIKMFPDINEEALSYVVNAVVKKYKGETFDFGQFNFDLADGEKTKFTNYLSSENFANLYAWANEYIQPISTNELKIIDGKWVRYEQDRNGTDNYRQLSRSIRGKGTGWCTAGEFTAKTQLQGGDFYVYYSNDVQGNPVNPRIAIRMEQGKIGEIRGIAAKQNLDSHMNDILATKLEEFPDKNQYLKKEADMKRLTGIDNKVKSGLNLDREDLIFLYELNSPIEGFGNENFGVSSDPRIKELRSQRNPEEDMLVVFGCDKSQIAHSVGEINRDTKAYVGSLASGIFDAIQRYNVEHVYTSFPEGRKRREAFEIGGKSINQLWQELKQANVNLSEDAEEDMLHGKSFTTLLNPEILDTIRLKVADLLPGNPTIDQICAKAKELGLEPVPAEAGVHYRIKYKDQPLNELLYVITDRNGNPDVFAICRGENGLWGDYGWANPDHEWQPDNEFMFALSPPAGEASKFEPKKPGLLDRFLKR